MSFQTLKKAILVQVAEDFAVDLPEDATKEDIIDRLNEDGVTWSMYKEAYPSEEDQDDAGPKGDPEKDDEQEPKDVDFKKSVNKVLLKMTRANGTFEVRGHRFTSAHPFLPVSEDDANYILENVDGFKIASPREADEYYS